MSRLGQDFSGGLFRRTYQPSNPAGLWYALAVAVGLVILHQLLQLGIALAILAVARGDLGNTREMVKASLVAILPAGLIVAALAFWLAGRRGGDAKQVLSLRWPKLSGRGWAAVIIGFMVVMYGAILAVVLALGIDMSQYTPGPDGQSPKSGSAGLVKEAMFDIANEPYLFLLVFPAIAIGAPLAEEMIFRGQLFSALSQTRLGVFGTTVVTAASWALLHSTEPWLSITLIFIMGLVFGWMMYRFGSLWLTIICHGAWNGFYALLIFGNFAGGP